MAPEIGQCWIIGDTPTGAWTGQAGRLACWTEGGWRFLIDVEGLAVWIKDQRLRAVREADGWVFGDTHVARVLIQDVQVLGAREPAVTLPTGGTITDVEARTAISMIVDRLVAHGLIDA